MTELQAQGIKKFERKIESYWDGGLKIILSKPIYSKSLMRSSTQWNVLAVGPQNPLF